jgi:hypothetical protein
MLFIQKYLRPETFWKKNAIFIDAEGIKQDWAMKKQKLSPRITP